MNVWRSTLEFCLLWWKLCGGARRVHSHDVRADMIGQDLRSSHPKFPSLYIFACMYRNILGDGLTNPIPVIQILYL